MDGTFQPAYLKNSPSIICDQVLYLVKNSNLNFELHETPFSLNLNLKKSFTHHWNKPNHSAKNNLYNETHASYHATEHVTDPVHNHLQHASVDQLLDLWVRKKGPKGGT